MKNWSTFNEPRTFCTLGYGTGFHAPGVKSVEAAWRCTQHVLESHAAAARHFRKEVPGGKLTMNLDGEWGEPLTDSADDRAAAFRREYPETCGRRLLLFLSRIEPIKGVTTLAQAWAECAREFPDWHLVVVGPDERSHLQDVLRILRDGDVMDRTTITGPLHGERKTAAYLASEIFVLPTISENFGLVIGEALSHGLPVITTTGAPWSGIAEHACGWWIEPTRAALCDTLRRSLAMPAPTLAAMGERGSAWISRDFTWKAEADSLLQTYEWLLGRREARPSFVSVDP